MRALIVGRDVSVDLAIAHPIIRHVENFSGDLAQRGREALAQLACPGLDHDAAGDRDLHRGTRGARLAASILESDRKADAATTRPSLSISDAIRGLPQSKRKVAVDRGIAVEVELARTQHIPDANVQRIESDPPRDHVDLAFAREIRLGAAEATERSGRNRRGAHRIGPGAERRPPVGSCRPEPALAGAVAPGAWVAAP